MSLGTVTCSRVRTGHPWFLSCDGLLRYWYNTVFELFLRGIFRHPETRLDPLLFGHHAHDAVAFVFHFCNSLGVCLSLWIKPFQFLSSLRLTGLCDTHFNLVKILHFFHDLVLQLPSLVNFLSPSLNFVHLFLANQLLALLDQVFSDALLAKQMTLRTGESRFTNATQAKTALIEFLLRLSPQTLPYRAVVQLSANDFCFFTAC